MTSADVVAILLRRWYIVIAGLALTAGAIFAFAERPGVYSTQADVLFLAPKSANNPNPIEVSSESLIATAGLVSHIIGDRRATPPTASSEVTLTGKGVRKGYSIRLPNSGGQWVNSFDRPVLDVQVAGPSEAWVRATLAQQILAIDNALGSLQRNDGIAQENLISTSLTPQVAKVVYSRGDPKRAITAILILGTTLTVLAAVGFEFIALKRHSSARKLPPLRMESA